MSSVLFCKTYLRLTIPYDTINSGTSSLSMQVAVLIGTMTLKSPFSLPFVMTLASFYSESLFYLETKMSGLHPLKIIY